MFWETSEIRFVCSGQKSELKMGKNIKYLSVITLATIVTGLIVIEIIFDKKCQTYLMLSENIESLSECEATFPDANGHIVSISCVGEKGTCHIKREEKVSTKYGNYTVWVDATCSGTEKK